jgi:hypothetical protein
MPLLAGDFGVAAVGAGNLHIIASRDKMAPPQGPEVAIDDELDPLHWTLRFFDPVVLPALGVIDESAGARGDLVRRALGLSTYLYHLVVQPGGQLTAHHATHAGSGLANAHLAVARDFEAIRAHARGREQLVDEMEGAAAAGLVRAQALLAVEIAGGDAAVAEVARAAALDAVALRRALLDSVRGLHG